MNALNHQYLHRARNKKPAKQEPWGPLTDARRAELVAKNQNLVHYICRPYAPYHSFDDLVQEGNIGLLRAIETFDPRKGPWGNHVFGWVRAYVWRWMKGDGVVRLPHSTKRAAQRDELQIKHLDAPWGESGSVSDSFASSDESPEERMQSQELRAVVREAIARMPMRKLARSIVELRLLTDSPLTLEEVGFRNGVTRECVRLAELKLKAKFTKRLAVVRKAVLEGADE